MAKRFELKCAGCGIVNGFGVADVDDLEEHIEDERAEAVADVRESDGWDCEDPNHLDLDEAFGSRLLQELSTAIRARDWVEAELLLDKLASFGGARAEEQVQQGRFSLAAAA